MKQHKEGIYVLARKAEKKMLSLIPKSRVISLLRRETLKHVKEGNKLSLLYGHTLIHLCLEVGKDFFNKENVKFKPGGT